VQQYVRRMLVIFPFEEAFYRGHGVEAEFVGHPLAEMPLPTVLREEFARENGLDAASTWIGVLPGSRPREIADHLPEILKAARMLAELPSSAGKPFAFLVPLAPTLSPAQRAQVHEIVREHGCGLTVRLVEEAAAALLHARASIVASGTATVEAALIGNPFVVIYRVSPITFAIAKRVVKVPHVAMANLIAGKRVVPELIQHDFTATKIVQQLERLLPDGARRQSMMNELSAIRSRLNTRPAGQDGEVGGAIERVARITLDQLGIQPVEQAGASSPACTTESAHLRADRRRGRR